MSSSLPPSQASEEDILQCVICYRGVVDPVLLTCLHSACSLCTRSDVSESVTCPTCQVTTDAPTEKTNLIVSSLAHRSQVLKDVFSCTQCIDEDNPDSIAIVWCYTCQQSLCVDCQKIQSELHSTHEVMHLNERTNLSELYRPPARSCAEHDEEFKFLCFACKTGRCYKCVHVCYTSSHDVLQLDSPDTLARMNDSVTHATRVLSELNSSLTPLLAYLSLPEKVLGAREESLATQKKAKQKAIDSISDAYKESAESLLECWDSLVVHSVTLREDAERLNRRVSWTNVYCKMALNSNDITGLLPQIDEVLSSLQTLLEEAKRFQEPVDPSTLVRCNTWLPSDLNLIASGWFGQATVVSDDFKTSLTDLPAEDEVDYYKRKVSTLNELEAILQIQKQELSILQCERQEMAIQQSEFILKDQELVTAQSEVEKLLEQKQELIEQLEQERNNVELLQSELTSRWEQLVATQSEVKKRLDEQDELRYQLERERQRVGILRSDLRSQAQQLVEKDNEKKKLLDEQEEKQKQLEQMRRKVEQLQSELEFATREKPLSFDGRQRGPFDGPGRCWDVAVTPQGSLLVAAMADGLKEYGATSFREIATWIPEAALIGQENSCFVRTVDVLSDGRALVGLDPNLIVLLRREAVSSSGGGNSSAAESWRVERRIAELQAPPRRLSAWGDRLLAVLEDRHDKSTNSWCCGPGLVLLSLSDSNKQLHRQQLDYDTISVALTDGEVIVASNNELELGDTVGSGRGNRKCYVVDCYSHFGVRLWRHEVGNGEKIMSVCLDSVGRVIYAAECRGPVVALRVDDGRRLSTAVELSRTETKASFAIAFDKATQCRLALISNIGQDEPNIINVFTVGLFKP